MGGAHELLSVEEIDLADPAFWDRPAEVRDGAFSLLRREHPVWHFDEWDARERSPFAPPPGNGFWAVTRYADVVEASRNPAVFRSGQGAVTVLDLPEEVLAYFSGLIAIDDPRHARLRRIVAGAFTPPMVRSIEEHVRRIAAEIVSSVAERGECDFATDVAAWLPLRIICQLMGVPRADEQVVLRCTDVIMSDGDDEYIDEGQDPVLAIVGAASELTEMMTAIGAERSKKPADDLTTALVTADVDGESLTPTELSSLFVCLLVAGSETTRTAISHALATLTEHPDQRADWQADADGVGPSAVDEVLRWASPVTWMRRTVAEPVTLGGQALGAGDKVLLYYASANRDEEVFSDPFHFDVRRSPNPHLGFGGGGPHFCLGAHLARTEIAAIWKELFAQVPDIHATAEPQHLRSSFLNGIKHLPCEWTPAAARSRASRIR